MEVGIGRIEKEFTWLGVVYERRNRDSMTPHDPNVGSAKIVLVILA